MIQGFDPRTAEPVGEPVAETTDAALDAIVASALAAAPAWGAGTALARRAAALEAVADALDDRAGELAVIADTETALGGERLIGEVARTTTQLRMFAGVVRNGSYEDAVVTHAEGVIPDLRRINRPVGPVAVFAASNFPFAFSVAGGDTASALAAGCPVVVKAHEAHPVTSDVTAEVVTSALASAGAPAGTFGLVHGVQAGLRLLGHPDIAAAGFTGSTVGGLALARICAERPVPIPFYGELGSVNPCVVLPGAASARPAEVATVHADPGSPGDLDLARQVIAVLERVAGRIVFNGWPTGVAVVAAQHHGGPWPATTAPAYTSVGTAAIRRWLVIVGWTRRRAIWQCVLCTNVTTL